MAAALPLAAAPGTLTRRLIRQRAMLHCWPISLQAYNDDKCIQPPTSRQRSHHNMSSCISHSKTKLAGIEKWDTGFQQSSAIQYPLVRSIHWTCRRFRGTSVALAVQGDINSSSTRSAPTNSNDDDQHQKPPIPHWTEWFPREEYGDVWSDGLDPLDCIELDTPTRYLISLLNDAVMGIRRGRDKATTGRCNRQLERLSDMSIGGKKLEGRAQRADDILRRMEKHLFADDHHHGHDSRHKYELPRPDRKTYQLVLRLFAKTAGPASVAERAEEIVANMQRAFEERGDLSLRPQTVAYNQVISTWACSTDHNKAYRAASVLAKMKEADMVDASSYSHVLRACATSDYTDKSRGAALKIAVGIWKDLDQQKEKRHMLTSHFYTFLLRTLGFMPNDKPKERDAAVKRAFTKCLEDGAVNAHVLHFFHLVASKNLYHESLGERLAIQGENAGPAVLAQKVPNSWTRNAKTANSWGW